MAIYQGLAKKEGLMNAIEILGNAGIDKNEPVVHLTVEEALENLVECIEEYCPNLRVDKMIAEDIRTLLHSYGGCVVDYHPESYHQERAALLENFEMLKRYGLTDDDYDALDFC